MCIFILYIHIFHSLPSLPPQTFLKEMEKDKVAPEAELLRVLLSLHISMNNTALANETLQKIMNNPNFSELTRHNAMVQAFCLLKRPKDAFDVINKMREKGWWCGVV